MHPARILEEAAWGAHADHYLHILAEFGRYPLQLSWQALAGKYLTRLEIMGTDRLLKYAYIADRRLKPKVSCRLRLEHQLQGLLIPSPTEEQPIAGNFLLFQPSLSIYSSSAWKPLPRA